MALIDGVTVVLLAASAFFFLAGTVGILRFPDTHSRLHAITKADNLGLGLLVAALVLQAGAGFVAAKLVLVWLVALVSSATSCFLLARRAAEVAARDD